MELFFEKGKTPLLGSCSRQPHQGRPTQLMMVIGAESELIENPEAAFFYWASGEI